jgi:hypothetical protein
VARVASFIRTLALAGLPACGRLLGTGKGPPPSPLEVGVVRPDQAPLMGLPDILTIDTLVGHRVRVLGWCDEAAGLLAGKRSGAWRLATPDTSIEVRGLVPHECAPSFRRQVLVLVFAQVVPAERGKQDRLLLRLPD